MQIKEGSAIKKITCPECGAKMDHFSYSEWLEKTTRLAVGSVEDGKIASVDVIDCDTIMCSGTVDGSDKLVCTNCDFEIYEIYNVNKFLVNHPELIELE